jgi:hypothetical protein
MQPTWRDHYNLNFWTWACLHDAAAYLHSFEKFRALVREKQPATRQAVQQETELCRYHFVMTAGSLAKHLARLVPLFPSVKSAYDAAAHFQKGALYLRNMCEHAEVNVAASMKGTPRGGFIRATSLGRDFFPGDQDGSVDAISVFIDNTGHWLGGRLSVQQVMAEVTPIYQAAQAIPPPASTMPEPPPGAPSTP